MRTLIWAVLGLGVVPQALAADTLSTKGFNLCMTDSDIKVQNLDVSYTRSTNEVVFDVAGTNAKKQKVIATLTVTAYGNELYSKTFDPCGSEIHVDQLCPVPAGTFSASGSYNIPDNYASQIPAIAFNIPDLDGQAKMTLKGEDGNNVACVESELSNGKSTSVKGVAWASAGIAAGALALSGLSAVGAAGHPGASSSSPGFGDVMGWFHSMATNGMLSVSYPTVYSSFTKNFAWSTGLISWDNMQHSIDDFRKATGGNLTQNSYTYLYDVSSSTTSSSNSTTTKRGLDMVLRVGGDLLVRSVETSQSDSTNSSSSSSSNSGDISWDDLTSVKGLEKVGNELMIPSANIFMTVLLIFAIVVAVVVVGILLVKVILEIWALYGNFPAKLATFRKDYWGLMARTITNMILVLYSIWVLYCVYQLKNGDSWAAKLLAAVTLAVFTAVLAFFAWRIIHMARKYKKAEGDTAALYDNKETWRKYSLFYDNYKKDFWWLFVPIIVYSLAKGCIIAGAQGHGLAQSAGQLVVEALLLILLLWNRPYVTKSSMGINMTIQIVRVLSVACVLVFVEELGLSQTTKTVTGIVLIVIQSTLTGVLAILIAVNAIIMCIRENPHAKRRKEAEKADRDLDDLTPLDARESLLIDHPPKRDYNEVNKFNFTGPYEPYRDQPYNRPGSNGSRENLVYADYGVAHDRSSSQQSRHSGRRSPSLEGRHPTTAGYGMAY
ncbi:hypothetical protein N7532_003376 [Penicillium argentinense]|uniref:ML-like domain-containing protein n=1 Tax=Penicillium argentinense TaxID=1131581 RepID=A0A9W9FMS6_9EURO|nr:uncharacterized protein N7532_003376 [Penicillium argentinense]KAJ5102847.1 hypothetical protein N7532_003376 [Penicillium argentinense]